MDLAALPRAACVLADRGVFDGMRAGLPLPLAEALQSRAAIRAQVGDLAGARRISSTWTPSYRESPLKGERTRALV